MSFCWQARKAHFAVGFSADKGMGVGTWFSKVLSKHKYWCKPSHTFTPVLLPALKPNRLHEPSVIVTEQHNRNATSLREVSVTNIKATKWMITLLRWIVCQQEGKHSLWLFGHVRYLHHYWNYLRPWSHSWVCPMLSLLLKETSLAERVFVEQRCANVWGSQPLRASKCRPALGSFALKSEHRFYC